MLVNDISFLVGSLYIPILLSKTSLPQETQQQADEIALVVKVSYESQGKPLLTIADAIAAGSYFKYPGTIEAGDAKG